MDNWGAIIYNTKRRLEANELTIKQAIARVEVGLFHCTKPSIGHRKVRDYLKELKRVSNGSKKGNV